MKRGFTLLELLISSLLLLSIMAILSLVITRANGMRRDAVRRTTLLTQGRAALEIIAEDIQNTISSNLEVRAQILVAGGDPALDLYGKGSNSVLSLIRVPRPLLPLSENGETNLPFETVEYTISDLRADSSRLADGVQYLSLTRAPYRYAALSDANLTETNLSFVTRRWSSAGASHLITNVIAGDGTTRLPSGKAGETIVVPVNRSDSLLLYDWITSADSTLEVQATDDPDFNLLLATVVVENSLNLLSQYANSQSNAPSGLWPAIPQTTVITGYQAVAMLNGRDHLTELFAITNSIAEAPLAYTNDALQQLELTNQWQILSWSGYDSPTPTNTPQQLLLGYYNHPDEILTNLWSLPANTNLFDGKQGRSEWYDLQLLNTTHLAITTNEEWLISSATNYYNFATNLPLSLAAATIITAAIGETQYATEAQQGVLALTLGEATMPLSTQSYWRASSIIATNYADSGGLHVTVAQTIHQATTNRLESLIPSTLLDPGLYSGERYSSTYSPVETRRDDTIFTPHRLDEDYDGGEVTFKSLWLESAQRDAREIHFSSNAVVGYLAANAEPKITELSLDSVVDGIVTFHALPLSFVWEDDQWRLHEWEPDKHEMPVCVDLYLELLDLSSAKRAATIRDKTAREAFVARNVVRLSRRVALRGRNRWGEP